MISNISASIHPAICEWEQARVSLVTALTNYSNLSLSLEEKALSDGTSPKDLAARIDTALWSMQATLDQQITRTRSILAHTRNRLRSSILQLPREILSEIFMHAIFATLDATELGLIETGITRMYLRIHTLLGVCKTWREILLAQGEIWSIIPIVDFSSRVCEGKHTRINLDYILSCSTERSKGDLHLLATQPWDSSHDGILAMLAPRFRTVNIATNDQSTIRNIMDMFLTLNSPEQLVLSRLSIYQDQDESYYDEPPPEEGYLFPLGSHEQESFERLVVNLSLLQIRGTQFHWDRFNFSHRLTELHLQEVNFGYESVAESFMSALSSADELRVLKLISIRIYYSGPLNYNPPTRLKFQFPNLQTLLLDDLYFNTMDWLLSSIASRSHRLTLFLNKWCQYIDLSPWQSPGAEDVTWETLCELLREVPVRELLISGHRVDSWPSPLELGELMKLVAPGLESLRVDSWDFDTQGCDILSCRSLSHSSNSPSSLTSIHITRARILDQEAFANMVTSHSGLIRQMVLGATVSDVDGVEWITVEGDQPLAFVLKNTVPNFRLVGCDFIPPQFEDALWRLW